MQSFKGAGTASAFARESKVNAMPNYYAHLQFGALVLSQLPQSLRARVEREREAYQIGQYGPDPLFFYHPLTRNFARMTGMNMHHEPLRAVAERLRQAVREEKPFAVGYTAGFLCHFALDSVCHAYIAQATRNKSVTHAGIESEFDRLLMERSGLDPSRDTPMPPLDMPADFYNTVCTYAYPGVTAGQFQAGFRLFRRVSRLYTRLVGHPARHAVNWLADTVPGCSFFRHAILTRKASPLYRECSLKMLELFRQAAAPTAEQLAAFFEGIPLGEWYDRDFCGGRRTPEGACVLGSAS